MEKKIDCCFCIEIEDRSKNVLNKNRVVLETKNFIVIPTVGCFQIGYLLVVPKKHILNFGATNDILFRELDEVIEKITSYVKKYMGKECIIFEHGTHGLSKETAASVVHAHIHIIPFEHNMIGFLPEHCKLKQIKGIKDLSEEKESYLYLRDKDGKNYIVKNDEYPSQFFRQIACRALDKPQCWNWKEYELKDNMEKTLDFYKNLQ